MMYQISLICVHNLSGSLLWIFVHDVLHCNTPRSHPCIVHNNSGLQIQPRFLIGLNSPKYLNISSAFVTSIDSSSSSNSISRRQDVTETMKKLNKRNNSIYVLNFKSDLDLSQQEGTLHLTAQFDEEEVFQDVISFTNNTEYLLCDL